MKAPSPFSSSSEDMWCPLNGWLLLTVCWIVLFLIPQQQEDHESMQDMSIFDMNVVDEAADEDDDDDNKKNNDAMLEEDEDEVQDGEEEFGDEDELEEEEETGLEDESHIDKVSPHRVDGRPPEQVWCRREGLCICFKPNPPLNFSPSKSSGVDVSDFFSGFVYSVPTVSSTTSYSAIAIVVFCLCSRCLW